MPIVNHTIEREQSLRNLLSEPREQLIMVVYQEGGNTRASRKE